MRNEFFGTPHVERYSKDDLFKESKDLIPALYCINQDDFENNEKDFSNILRLFEIIMYGRDKYPFLLKLGFDNNERLTEISIWEDPRFSNNNNHLSAFRGYVKGIPSLSFLKEKRRDLKNIFDYYLFELKKMEELDKNICIAGNEFCILNIGKANADFFENRKPKFVFSKK